MSSRPIRSCLSQPAPAGRNAPALPGRAARRVLLAALIGLALPGPGPQASAHGSFTHRIAHWFSHLGSHPAQARRRVHPAPVRPVFATLPGAVAGGAVQPVTGTAYVFHDWDGTLASLKHGLSSPTPPWSAIQLDTSLLDAACQAGLLRPRPATQSQNAPPSCGYEAGVIDIVLAWDRTRLADVTDEGVDWPGFWDIARHPGKRGLHADPRGTLEIALLSDGVAPDDIYRVLGTEDGVARAFRRLDLLRPYVVWWHDAAEAASIMENGAALMAAVPAAEITVADAHPPRGRANPGFVAQWRQSLRDSVFWAIPHNLQESRATAIDTILRDNAPHHDDSRGAPLTGSPSLTIDAAFWKAHGADLDTRFHAWLGQP